MLSNIFEIKKITKFDLFIEIFSFAVFLDIIFAFHFSQGLFDYTAWEDTVSKKNIGKFIYLLIIYGMHRISLPLFICHFTYKISKYFFDIFKTKESNSEDLYCSANGYESILKAKIISINKKDSFLNEKIKDFQKERRVIINLSVASINALLLFAVNMFCKNTGFNKILNLIVNNDFFEFKKFTIIIITVIFIISLVFIVIKGYDNYFNEKIYCHEPIPKVNTDTKK